MYIDFSKLWKLLNDRNMTKSELIEKTGISSRVMAKLSKNKTVTTDTVARICTVLGCDVSDIMECVSEESLSFYDYFRKFARITDKGDTCDVYECEKNGRKFVFYVTKRAANKGTQIFCEEGGAVVWKQIGQIGNFFSAGSEEFVIAKPKRQGAEIVVVLIKGKPSVIVGLDENGFVSSRSALSSPHDIYVMSEAALKNFKE